MVPIYVFSAILVVISASLIIWHVWAWWAAKHDHSLDKFEIDFRWRQCRRRSQASGLIGLIGIGLASYRLVPLNGIVVLLYVLALGTLALWIILLAIADVAATHVHYGSVQRRNMKKQ